MKKLLIPILLIGSMLGIYAQGFKISAYPNKATPGESDLFLMATPNVANWNITAAQLRQFMTNNVTIALPPGLLTNNDTRNITFLGSVTTGDLTVNGTLTVNSTNAETIVSNLTVYGWQTNLGVISSTNFTGVFYGNGAGLTNISGGVTNNQFLPGIASTSNRFVLYAPNTPSGATIDFHRPFKTNDNGFRWFNDDDDQGGLTNFFQIQMDNAFPSNTFFAFFDSMHGADVLKIGLEDTTHGHYVIGTQEIDPATTFWLQDWVQDMTAGRLRESFRLSSETNGIAWESVSPWADALTVYKADYTQGKYIHWRSPDSFNSWRLGTDPVAGGATYDMVFFSSRLDQTLQPQNKGTEVLRIHPDANNTNGSGDVMTFGGNIVNRLGSYYGNASGLTNLPVAGINASGIGATKYLKGDGTWDIPSAGAATNVVWPVAGTNTLLVTNGLEVQINAPIPSTVVTNGQDNVAFGLLGITNGALTETTWQILANGQATFTRVKADSGSGQISDITADSVTTSNGFFSGPVLSTSSTTNNPSATELATAGWIRSLFNNGLLFYSTTNLYAGATNSDYPNIYSFASTIPDVGARGYTNTALTAGNYIGTVITTNRFSQVAGPIDVDSYIGLTSSGNPIVSIHPEIYYSYDLTNWYGDFSAGNETIVLGTTNLYQWVISFPNLVATNAEGFYIARRFKVGTASGLQPSTILWATQGTNAISGTGSASHIAIDGPNSALGNAFLANNQVWTGSNSFTGPTVFTGPVYGVLTNGSTNVTLNGLTVNDYLIINATNATTTVSNLLVTGWQTNYGVLSSTNFVGKFAGDGTGLTNITAAQTPWTSDINGNQKSLTNVATIQVSGGGTNWFDASYFTNGIYGNGAGLTNLTVSGGGGTNMMVSTITYGTTISPTFAISGLSTTAASCRRVVFRLTLTGNVTTVNAPAGTLIDGDTMVWEMIQDGTGSRTITGWDAKYAFGTDITTITLSTTASKRDFATFVYNLAADKWYATGFVRGY